jgi:hypothetical protein
VNLLFDNMLLHNQFVPPARETEGLLTGNHFSIVLRNVTATDEEVGHAAELWIERGFINYYGLQVNYQRSVFSSPPPHVVFISDSGLGPHRRII